MFVQAKAGSTQQKLFDRILDLAQFPEARIGAGEGSLALYRVPDKSSANTSVNPKRERRLVLSQTVCLDRGVCRRGPRGRLAAEDLVCGDGGEHQPQVAVNTAPRQPLPLIGYRPTPKNGGKVLRYSDHCLNGDCTLDLRERAPSAVPVTYCYHALTQQWSWNPNGY